MKKLIFLATFISISANATLYTKIQDSKDLSISIYNNNLAMVNEQRDVNIKQNGKQKLIYEDIASSVIFESIIAKFSKPTTLYSQNYQYDILSLDKLLQKSINKKIYYKKQVNDYEYKKQEAVLLALNPILIKEGNEIISGIKRTDIIFSKIPDNIITKPSLIWNTKSQKGKQSINLNYLTKSISWRSDYVLNLDKKNTLNGWISITNNSGTTYKDANIYCIAGDVKTQSPRKYDRRIMLREAKMFKSANSIPVQQKQFAGYNLYKIPFKETIQNKQKKQINFINKQDIKIDEYASVSNNIYFHRFSKINNVKFNHKIEFENKKSNNLGIPLPKGTIRVYKKDEKLSHFIGQDNISHSAKGEKISIVVGKYFDIIQSITQNEFKQTKQSIMSKYTRVIKNKSKNTQIIKIVENNYSNNIESFENKNNCKENCSMKKIGISNFEYTIQLRPNSSYKLITKYKINYERY